MLAALMSEEYSELFELLFYGLMTILLIKKDFFIPQIIREIKEIWYKTKV